MRTLAKSFTLALAAAAVAATSVSPAFAGDDTAPRRSVRVAFSDLDLATADGQHTLDKRVAKAVRQVCRTVSAQTGTRIMDQDTQNCLARARAQAKQQVAALIPNVQRGG